MRGGARYEEVQVISEVVREEEEREKGEEKVQIFEHTVQCGAMCFLPSPPPGTSSTPSDCSRIHVDVDAPSIPPQRIFVLGSSLPANPQSKHTASVRNNSEYVATKTFQSCVCAYDDSNP